MKHSPPKDYSLVMKKTYALRAFIVIISLLFFALQQSQTYNKKITDLQRRLDTVYLVLNISQDDINKQNITLESISTPQKTQEQLITQAVAKINPAVVSIIISKNTSDFEIKYVNPFENSPFFKNIKLRIPIYTPTQSSKEEIGAGTGLIIHKNGYILTNNHVVSDKESDYTAQLSNGAKKEAKVIYRDAEQDVAVLKIEGSYPLVASLGDSSSLQLGQTVIAVGNALGEYNNTISTGIISGLDRNIEAEDENSTIIEKLKNVIQTDVSVNPGSSGGPLTNLNGDVIGINVATAVGSNNINFSIPINSVKKSIKNIIPE